MLYPWGLRALWWLILRPGGYSRSVMMFDPVVHGPDVVAAHPPGGVHVDRFAADRPVAGNDTRELVLTLAFGVVAAAASEPSDAVEAAGSRHAEILGHVVGGGDGAGCGPVTAAGRVDSHDVDDDLRAGPAPRGAPRPLGVLEVASHGAVPLPGRGSSGIG